ncbi:hypothetical protein Golax_017524 [Gossypium laxum]|uniref:Uncharacterized protein n=1 Tax=Gossypium laxum TaxID=34288 RepID=A0A7J8Z0H1_9ROSI|nr:hypothetical protein [Gossypium laxum]
MSRNQLNRALLPSWLLENNTDLKLGNDEFTGGLITKKEFYAGMETFDVSNNKMTVALSNFDSEIGSAHAVGLIYSFSWSEAGYDFVKSLRELYDSRSLMDSVMLEDKYMFKIDKHRVKIEFVTKNSLLPYTGNILN